MSTDAILQDILNELRSQRGGGGGASAGGGGTAPGALSAAFDKLTKAATSTANGLMSFGTRAADGAVGLGDIAAVVPRLPGAFGLLNVALNHAVSMVEKNIATYQNLSNSGITFGGSLTQMRLSATSMYMTMDQFSGLMSKNSETFARLGGTANEGARAFTKVAASLVQGELGDNLRALGYTSEQVNQGLANYLAMTGGRTRKEMENSDRLAKSAANYMAQLDALAEISGKSREEQEAAMKEASANQAYQSYLLTLDEASREKANAAMAEALAKGGKGAQQALQSALLGLPPMTKAAQEFTALAPNATKANMAMAGAVTDSSKSVSDIRKQGANMGVAVANDVKRMGETTKNAIIMQGGELAGTVGQMAGTANQLKAQGIKTEADAQAQLAKVQADQEARKKSEAATYTKLQTDIKALGLTIYNALIPAFNFLMGVVVEGANLFKKFVIPFFKNLDFEGAMKPFLDFWKKLETAIMSMDWKGIADSATATFNVLWSSIKEVFQPLFEKASGIFTAISDDMGPVFQDFSDIFKLVFARIQDVIGLLKTYVWPVMQPVLNGIVDSLIPLWNIFKLIINSIKALLSGDFAKIGQNFGEVFGEATKVFQNIKEGLTGGISKIISFFKGEEKPPAATPPKAAIGGIFSGPTSGYPIIAHGTEAVVPIKSGNGADAAKALGNVAGGSSENLVAYLQTLNSISAEMLRYMKETADYTRRNVDATRSLNGNLFPTP